MVDVIKAHDLTKSRAEILKLVDGMQLLFEKPNTQKLIGRRKVLGLP